MIDQQRRLSFGSVAELYDQARPDYPEELVDDVIAYAGCAPGDEVVEIGAGTGKATRMFCARGLSVVAIEPDAGMAAVASRRAATAGDHVRIIESDFESATLPAAAFPLLYSAQAWHWIDPNTGYAAARRVLRDGGALAAFWNRADWRACELRAELRMIYERAGIAAIGGDADPTTPAAEGELEFSEEWHAELARAAGFDQVEVKHYERVLDYGAVEYVALLRTHSRYIVLAPKVRKRLLAEVGAAIERHGRLRLPVLTLLGLARAA